MKKKQKIFVGVSGGVDSSVVAYLLKKEGHDVHGVFIKTWSPEWLPCTWLQEKRDAMRVCASLDIPFHFLDAEKAYKDGVADFMIAEYKAGRTPNPDVLCNRVIKFGVLWDYAHTQGADVVATGHYAQVQNRSLLQGVDISKDQSYFLWMLKKAELCHIVFPIGHLQKSQVREIAMKAKLFTATKKDSQGICFLGDVDMRAFLEHYIDIRPGNVIDEAGNAIGTHTGVWFYTLGERHGFAIANTMAHTSPYYVVAKDVERNTLTVSNTPKPHTQNGSTVIVQLRDANWIEVCDTQSTYTAHIRYHGEYIEAKVLNKKEVELTYNGLIALGQSLVVYKDGVLVGGGIIESASFSSRP